MGNIQVIKIGQGESGDVDVNIGSDGYTKNGFTDPEDERKYQSYQSEINKNQSLLEDARADYKLLVDQQEFIFRIIIIFESSGYSMDALFQSLDDLDTQCEYLKGIPDIRKYLIFVEKDKQKDFYSLNQEYITNLKDVCQSIDDAKVKVAGNIKKYKDFIDMYTNLSSRLFMQESNNFCGRCH